MEVAMDFNAYMNLLHSQKNLPFILFASVFAVLAALEMKFYGYEEKFPRVLRWPHHFLLVALNIVIFQVLLPSFCLLAAISAFIHRFGLFNQVRVPDTFGIIFTIIFLDWMLYYFHRVYHAVPWLWKIHRVHHTDREVDVTTGLRFHPLEILMTTFVEVLFIYLLGAPVYGVFLFQIWLGVSTLFNHSNIQIPAVLEKVIRWFILTPDMHRVHHSANPSETNSNFGFNFPWWDRLFMTYHESVDPKKEKLGLNIFEEIRYSRFKLLLMQPFLDKQGKFKFKNIIRGN
jgi:sterol desaturase/sphingolipid hydroxylase (fatty acid hydroxylase superfamily)